MRPKSNLIVIVGPTVSGKSELSVRLAKKNNGEIISADSRQIYRGLDIGTAKVPGKWQHAATITSIRSFENDSERKFAYKGIRHHCLDFVSPRKTFTVAEFKKCAERAIHNITSRKKLPIIVGGTGFWINALVYGLKLPEVPPNPQLRKKFEKKNTRELFRILKRLDPKRAKTIEKENPRRLIRAIEIAETLGRVPEIRKDSPYNTFWIGLNPLPSVLKKRIEKRSRRMIRNGIIEETKKLLESGVSKKRVREFGFEYTASLDFIEGKLSRADLSRNLVQDTVRYAKRQMSWWKKNPEIRWYQSPAAAFKAIGPPRHPN